MRFFRSRSDIFFLIVFIFAIIIVVAATVHAGTLTCIISQTCNSPSVIIFKMASTTNSHAELVTGSSYLNFVCCSGVTGLGNSCAGTATTTLKLSSTTNAHVEENGQGSYANNACISVSAGSVSVGYKQSNCAGFDTTLVSISATSSAHVSVSSTYATQVCATASASANSPPSVSGVSLNGGTNLTLTPNTTTSFNINYSITDPNGCSNINTNTATSTAFRKGIQATCAVPNPTTNNLNCYLNLTRATSSCIGGTQINVTDTVAIYYFAQSTGNASSSFPSDNWAAFAMANDTAGATGSATSSAVNVNILTSISITTSSINYGNIVASSTSGSINQVATTTNVGNSSTTLKVRASATLTNGLFSIPTSSQRFATSTFTFPGGATQLSNIDNAITGFLLTSPTSTTSVQLPTFWGLEVPAGMATGTYSGTNVFTSVFSP